MTAELFNLVMIFLGLVVAGSLGGVLYLGWQQRLQMDRLVLMQEEAVKHLPAARDLEQLPARLTEPVASGVQQGLNAPVERLSRELATASDRSKAASEAAIALREELERFFGQFQGAVTALGETGRLEAWETTLCRAIRPLEEAQGAIEQHYKTSSDVLDTCSRLLEQWSSQRDTIARSYHEFSELLGKWTAAEQVGREEIERRIMDRLREVAEQSREVASNLSGMRSDLQKMTAAVESVNGHGNSLIVTMNEVLRLQKGLVESQQGVAKLQEDSIRDLTARQEALSDCLKSLAETTSAALEGLTRQAGLAQTRMEEKLSGLIAEYQGQIQAVGQEQKALVSEVRSHQQEAQTVFLARVKENHELWQEAARSLPQLPTLRHAEQLHRLLYVLIAVQGFTLLFTAYYALVRH